MLKKYKGTKLKQYGILVGVAVVGLFVMIVLPEILSSPEKPQKKKEIVKVDTEKQMKKTIEEEWKSKAQKQIQELSITIKNLENQIKELKNEKKKEPKFENLAAPPPPPPPEKKITAPPPPPPPSAAAARKKKEMVIPDIGVTRIEVQEKPLESEKEQRQKKTPDKEYIPAGSFFTGVLLNGLDAPTGMKAKSDPHPVLIELTDFAQLPNDWKEDVKKCFVLAEGYGDLSSERAYLRTTAISCVAENGTRYEMPLRGYVTGEDGKVGLRGIVVSRQGALLARMLVSGFLEGVASAFQQASQVVMVSPTGTTSTVKPEDALKMSAFSGAGKAAEKLAEVYAKLAEETWPVVEINAGRKVNIIVEKGISLSKGEVK
ncbi:TraB/VirB10 family protein [Desulfurobacterium sp. TC5-1]|uniref:TraB/VirB10 family protein n=1 Tax=Desulfurobacterium sp. TC5-1 TaxID=1158318 RepID=UPI0003B77869|nr:TraB/VirB10 family protein [Desulfurobacterium sp. TC5-1]